MWHPSSSTTSSADLPVSSAPTSAEAPVIEARRQLGGLFLSFISWFTIRVEVRAWQPTSIPRRLVEGTNATTTASESALPAHTAALDSGSFKFDPLHIEDPLDSANNVRKPLACFLSSTALNERC